MVVSALVSQKPVQRAGSWAMPGRLVSPIKTMAMADDDALVVALLPDRRSKLQAFAHRLGEAVHKKKEELLPPALRR